MARFHTLALSNGTISVTEMVDNQLIGEPVKAGARVQLIRVENGGGNWFHVIRNEGATAVDTGMHGFDAITDEGAWEIVEVVD
jgi:hypothetical protein